MGTQATKFIIFLISFGFNNHFSAASYQDEAAALCGSSEWVVYSDTKCLKLVNTPLTYDEALAACDLEAAGREPQPILTLNSQEEQKAVTAFLFDQLSIADNVWLGATRSENPALGFVWLDGTPPEFANWAPGSPSNDLEKNCSQLTSKLSRENGEWRDVSCNTRNIALCQKEQQWSLTQLRATLLRQRSGLLTLRLDHDAHVIKYDSLKTAHDSLKTAHNSLKTLHDLLQTDHNALKVAHNSLQVNPVPLNFIYVQLPNQNAPHVIWPSVTWLEVTKDYAGLFFRAEGGGSASFGSTQGDQTRRIDRAETQYIGHSANPTIDIPEDGWGGYGKLTYYPTQRDGFDGIRFHGTGGEVRPRNTAIRIWKRTK